MDRLVLSFANLAVESDERVQPGTGVAGEQGSNKMTWLQRYRFRQYFNSSLWIFPAFGMIVALAAVRLLHAIEATLGWTVEVEPSTALTLLGTLAASMFSFVVFVCSALLISVQLASAQLTPRFIGIVLQRPATKISLTLFVFTFAFTLAALVQIKGAVPMLTAYAAVYCCLVSLGYFLYLVDHVCKALRPSGALAIVARLGHEVIKNVYPQRLSGKQGAAPELAKVLAGEPRGSIPNLQEGVVLAFDMKGLVSLAQRADCVIEMVPQVGDFVACRTAPVPYHRRRSDAAGGGAAPIGRRWSGTNFAARSGFRLPDHGGCRFQRPFPGDQRPDHRGSGH